MFKKPKRNFRSRQNDSDSEDEAQLGKSKDESKSKPASQQIDVNSASIANHRLTDAILVSNHTKKKDKDKTLPKVPATNTVLSFEQEEEGEVFQIKKSSHSRRVIKQLKRESLKEKLEPSIKLEHDSSGHQNGNHASQQIKKELSESRVVDAVAIKAEDEDDDDDDDDEEEEFGDLKKVSSGPSVEDVLKSGQIPDANMIHLVRKRRQMAREMDDFIPVDDTVKFENKSSRLIRDDDNDLSDSEEDENLAITKHQKEMNRRMLQERILAAEEESGTSDQERDEWEEQQIRKGVSIPAQSMNPPVPVSNMDNFYYSGYGQFMYDNLVPSSASASSSSLMAYGASSSALDAGRMKQPPKDSKPISMEASKQKLNDRLNEMFEMHRMHVHDRDAMSSRQELNLESIEKLQGQTMGLEEQYRFFQEMRGYVRDLVECMNEKMSSINFLDRCMMKLWKETADKLVKRYQADVKDQSIEYIPGKLNTGVAAAAASDSAEEHARNRRRADREGRRNRRKHLRESQGIRDHCDGTSTDDEVSISESKKYKTEHERLMTDTSSAFDDVVDDFCRSSLIKGRFERWKNEFSESYNEAYIGLCLTKLFTPLVKLELITWNPLEENCLDFEKSSWFSSLLFYGYKEVDVNDCQRTNDPDLKLLPNIVDKVLLPKLTVLVETVWNPLSMKQTKKLVTVVHNLIENYPTVNFESKNTQILIKTVVDRIKKTLDDDIFMPLYPKQVLENRTSGPAIFFYRQFWMCVKLLRSVGQWQGIVSEDFLKELSLDGLLNRYMVIALQNAPSSSESIPMSHGIISSIPRDWFSACKSDSTLPQLENLCRFLVNTASTMLEIKEARDTVRQFVKMLVSLHATSHASKLAARAHFKVSD